MYPRFLLVSDGSFSKREINQIAKMFDEGLSNLSTYDNFCLIHGDLTQDHILFNSKSSRISGIIDFGDLIFGDPALDFAGLYYSYGKNFVEEVLEFYANKREDNLIKRIEDFYIKQLPIHDYLHGIENRDEKQIVNSIRNIKQNFSK